MSNVYVNSIGVPRTARNKRIYAGVSFQATNDYQESSTTNTRHIEAGKIELETGDTKSQFRIFTQPFTKNPIIMNFKVYRMEEISSDFWVQQDVLHGHAINPFITTAGFQVSIDGSEDINGVIIEYCFTE